ncbi:MAG: hypothetical protein U0521_30135 [Anaerolineae bacterium]
MRRLNPLILIAIAIFSTMACTFSTNLPTPVAPTEAPAPEATPATTFIDARTVVDLSPADAEFGGGGGRPDHRGYGRRLRLRAREKPTLRGGYGGGGYSGGGGYGGGYYGGWSGYQYGWGCTPRYDWGYRMSHYGDTLASLSPGAPGRPGRCWRRGTASPTRTTSTPDSTCAC